MRPEVLAGLALVAGLSGCAPVAGGPEALRLSLVRDDVTVRVELQRAAEPAPGRYALQVIPAGTKSIELRLQNGPAQAPALLTADRVATFDTTAALTAKDFTKLRPGQYRLVARAYSATGGAGGAGAILGERILVQSFGSGTTTVPLKLRIVALTGDVDL
jgi:hypothetical protein